MNYKSAIWFIEEYLCHYNAIAMCYESYHSKRFEDLFENEFVEFKKFQEDYDSIMSSVSKEDIEFAIRNMLRLKREIPLKKYIHSLSERMNSLGIKAEDILDEYINMTNAFKTADTLNGEINIQLGVPMYLLNKIRKVEEL